MPPSGPTDGVHLSLNAGSRPIFPQTHGKNPDHKRWRGLAARVKIPLRPTLPFPLLLPLPERVYTPRNTLAISL